MKESAPRSGRRGGRPPLLVLALLGALLAGCSPLYVLRAGYEEAKILSRRQPIARLVQDSTLPPGQRAKLSLVLEVRAFAADSLDLAVGDSYTTFSQLDSDTLALVLSAAHRDRFQAHTWWFPIVGHVPYKGFFSERKARAEIEKLERAGFDTYLRPTSAFSTLGWFNDPLVSPLLRYDTVSLAATVVHEVFHNTIYLPGEAMFNESLAEFVGARGAIAFLCGRFGEGSGECARARASWQDELLFGRFLGSLVAELEALYAREDLDREGKLAAREEVFARALRTFEEEVRPRFRVATYASFARDPLNNATLLSRRLYYHRLDLFEEVHRAACGDLRRTIALLLDAARDAEDPYEGVERLMLATDGRC